MGARRHKWGAQPITDTTDPRGGWFASRLEHERWQMLLMLERAGAITALARQVTFPLCRNMAGRVTRSYRADFIFIEIDRIGDGVRLVVEDAKGASTATWRRVVRSWPELYPGIELRAWPGTAGRPARQGGRISRVAAPGSTRRAGSAPKRRAAQTPAFFDPPCNTDNPVEPSTSADTRRGQGES